MLNRTNIKYYFIFILIIQSYGFIFSLMFSEISIPILLFFVFPGVNWNSEITIEDLISTKFYGKFSFKNKNKSKIPLQFHK